MRRYTVTSVLVLCLAGILTGACQDPNSTDALAQGKQPAPAVIVAPVTSESVANSMEFVGQTEAHQRVDLRARVTGTLIAQDFKEGATVKKGSVLYEIDPAEYKAARDSAAAKVEGAKATIVEAENTLKRYQILVERGTSSQASLDEAVAKQGQAKADLAGAEADLERAELDLGYTKISTPIGGQIGKTAVDVGNLIGPDTGILASVIAMDPIRVVFSVSEQQYLEYRQAISENRAEDFTPRIRLANGERYAHEGTWDFIENEVDSATGTIKLRVKFPNPDQLILPGLFVNMILESADPKDQLVVPQISIQENQSGPFVLVVDGDNRVELRPVETGARTGAQIVVSNGLTKGEMIIVDGIQKVRPGGTVDPVRQNAGPSAN